MSSIGRSNWKFTGLRLHFVLASASGLMFCFFMLLVVLVFIYFTAELVGSAARPPTAFSTIQGTFPHGVLIGLTIQRGEREE